MKDTLYRIETTMRLENPELRGSVMIMCNGGALFAELHPVKIKANVKEPCELCRQPPAKVGALERVGPNMQIARMHRPRYCFNCGRWLPTEEARP
jgi:hypothetical protein